MSARRVGDLRIETLSGETLKQALPDLAALRIRVFRAYPYLYDGDQDYETRYLAAYAESAGAVIVGAFDADALVGAATAAPIEDHFARFAALADHLDAQPRDILYFGESVLDLAYRGRGVGHAFFDAREAAAHAAGRSIAAFCSVIRIAAHPSRPAGYTPLDPFWRRRGYSPVDGFTTSISWRDVGDADETEKPMQFWVRRLNAAGS